MRKLSIILILLLSAVYSFGSECSLELKRGTSLVSIPCAPEKTDIYSLFGGYLDSVEMISLYDGEKKEWKSFDPRLVTKENLTYELPYGAAFYIGVNKDVKMVFDGEPLNCADYTLKTGWNLLGFTTESLNRCAADGLRYDAGTDNAYFLDKDGRPQRLFNDETLTKAKGYFLDIAEKGNAESESVSGGILAVDTNDVSDGKSGDMPGGTLTTVTPGEGDVIELTLNIQKGLNFVSIPVELDSYNITDIFAGRLNDIEYIQYYALADDESREWTTYYPSLETEQKSISNISSFYLYAENAFEISFSGAVRDVKVGLKRGWNMFAVSEETAASSISDYIYPVYSFNKEGAPAQVTDEKLMAGRGYWVVFNKSKGSYDMADGSFTGENDSDELQEVLEDYVAESKNGADLEKAYPDFISGYYFGCDDLKKNDIDEDKDCYHVTNIHYRKNENGEPSTGVAVLDQIPDDLKYFVGGLSGIPVDVYFRTAYDKEQSDDKTDGIAYVYSAEVDIDFGYGGNRYSETMEDMLILHNSMFEGSIITELSGKDGTALPERFYSLRWQNPASEEYIFSVLDDTDIPKQDNYPNFLRLSLELDNGMFANKVWYMPLDDDGQYVQAEAGKYKGEGWLLQTVETVSGLLDFYTEKKTADAEGTEKVTSAAYPLRWLEASAYAKNNLITFQVNDLDYLMHILSFWKMDDAINSQVVNFNEFGTIEFEGADWVFQDGMMRYGTETISFGVSIPASFNPVSQNIYAGLYFAVPSETGNGLSASATTGSITFGGQIDSVASRKPFLTNFAMCLAKSDFGGIASTDIMNIITGSPAPEHTATGNTESCLKFFLDMYTDIRVYGDMKLSRKYEFEAAESAKSFDANISASFRGEATRISREPGSGYISFLRQYKLDIPEINFEGSNTSWSMNLEAEVSKLWSEKRVYDSTDLTELALFTEGRVESTSQFFEGSLIGGMSFGFKRDTKADDVNSEFEIDGELMVEMSMMGGDKPDAKGAYPYQAEAMVMGQMKNIENLFDLFSDWDWVDNVNIGSAVRVDFFDLDFSSKPNYGMPFFSYIKEFSSKPFSDQVRRLSVQMSLGFNQDFLPTESETHSARYVREYEVENDPDPTNTLYVNVGEKIDSWGLFIDQVVITWNDYDKDPRISIKGKWYTDSGKVVEIEGVLRVAHSAGGWDVSMSAAVSNIGSDAFTLENGYLNLEIKDGKLNVAVSGIGRFTCDKLKEWGLEEEIIGEISINSITGEVTVIVKNLGMNESTVSKLADSMTTKMIYPKDIHSLKISYNYKQKELALALDVDMVLYFMMDDPDNTPEENWPIFTAGVSFTGNKSISVHISDADFKPKEGIEFDINNLSFTKLEANYTAEGSLTFKIPKDYNQGAIAFPEEIDLDVTYGTAGFIASAVLTKPIMVDVFGSELSTAITSLTVSKCSPWGISFGGQVEMGGSKENVNVGYRDGSFVFSAPGSATVGFDLIKDNVRADISNFSVILGSNVSFSGRTALKTTESSPLRHVIGEEMDVDLIANKDGITFSSNMYLNLEMDMGAMGKADIELTKFAISSSGVMNVTGTITINGSTMAFGIGEKTGAVFFYADVGDKGIEADLKPVFDMVIKKTFGVKNLMMFQMVYVDSLHLSAGDGNKLASIEADVENFQYVLPSSIPPVGFPFFDSFEYQIYLVGFGLGAEMEMTLPGADDFMSVMTTFMDIIGGNADPDKIENDLKQIDDPHVGVNNLHMSFPEVPGYAWDTDEGGMVYTDNVFEKMFHTNEVTIIDSFVLAPSQLAGVAQVGDVKQMIKSMIPEDKRKGSLDVTLAGFDLNMDYAIKDSVQPKKSYNLTGLPDVYNGVQKFAYVYDKITAVESDISNNMADYFVLTDKQYSNRPDLYHEKELSYFTDIIIDQLTGYNPNGWILQKGNNATEEHALFLIDGKKLAVTVNFDGGGSQTCVSDTVLAAGHKYNAGVGVNLTGGVITIQLDGKTDKECSVDGDKTIAENHGGLYIGRRAQADSATNFQGTVGDVTFYDKDIIHSPDLQKIKRQMLYSNYLFIPQILEKSTQLSFDLGALFTVAGRFNITDTSKDIIVFEADYDKDKSGNDMRVMYHSDGRLGVTGYIQDKGYFSCSTPADIIKKQSVNYAAVYDSGAGEMSLYINGAKLAECAVEKVTSFKPDTFYSPAGVSSYNEFYDGDIFYKKPAASDSIQFSMPENMGGGDVTVSSEVLDISSDLLSLSDLLNIVERNAEQTNDISKLISGLTNAGADIKSNKHGNNEIVMNYRDTNIIFTVKSYESQYDITELQYKPGSGGLSEVKARFGTAKAYTFAGFYGSERIIAKDTSLRVSTAPYGANLRSVSFEGRGRVDFTDIVGNVHSYTEDSSSLNILPVTNAQVIFDLDPSEISEWNMTAVTRNGLRLDYDSGGIIISSPEGTKIVKKIKGSRLDSAIKDANSYLSANSYKDFLHNDSSFLSSFFSNNMGSASDREYTGTSVYRKVNDKSYAYTPITFKGKAITGISSDGSSDRALAIRTGSVTLYEKSNYKGNAIPLTDNVSDVGSVGLTDGVYSVKMDGALGVTVYGETDYKTYQKSGSWTVNDSAITFGRDMQTSRDKDGSVCAGFNTKRDFSFGPGVSVDSGDYLGTFTYKFNTLAFNSAGVGVNFFSYMTGSEKHVANMTQSSSFGYAGKTTSALKFHLKKSEKIDLRSEITMQQPGSSPCLFGVGLYRKNSEGLSLKGSEKYAASRIKSFSGMDSMTNYTPAVRSVRIFRTESISDMDDWSVSVALPERVTFVYQKYQGDKSYSINMAESANSFMLDEERGLIYSATADSFRYPDEGYQIYYKGNNFTVTDLTDVSDFVKLVEHTAKMPDGSQVKYNISGGISANVKGTAIDPVISNAENSSFRIKGEDSVNYKFNITPEGRGFHSAVKTSTDENVSVIWKDNIPTSVPADAGTPVDGGFFGSLKFDAGPADILKIDISLEGEIKDSGDFYFDGGGDLILAGYTISEAEISLGNKTGLYIRGMFQVLGSKVEVSGYIKPNRKFALTGEVDIGIGGKDSFTGVIGKASFTNDPKLDFDIFGGLYVFGSKMLTAELEIVDDYVKLMAALSVGPAKIDGDVMVGFADAVYLGYDLHAYLKYTQDIKIYGVTKWHCKHVLGVKVCYPKHWGWKKIGSVTIHADEDFSGSVSTSKLYMNFGVGDVVYNIPKKSLSVEWK